MASIIKSDNGVSSGITGIIQSADSSGQLALQTTTSGGAATTAVTIDNTQKVTFANSIGFSSNAGITFNNSSATVNSTLNDYETGTWTPTVAGDATGSISNPSGNYTKIGNIVIATGQFNVTSNFTSNSIGGLPFTPSSTNMAFNNLGYFWNGNIGNLLIVKATTVMSNISTSNTAQNPSTANVGFRFCVTYQATF
jgi:hypothetical protein